MAAVNKCTHLVTVGEGDTCESLAAAAMLPVQLLYHLNPGVKCTPLQHGQGLCLFYRSGCGKGYAVAAGDSCDSIAAAHDLSSTQMLLLNEGLECNNLVAGQVLCVMPEDSQVRGKFVIAGTFPLVTLTALVSYIHLQLS